MTKTFDGMSRTCGAAPVAAALLLSVALNVGLAAPAAAMVFPDADWQASTPDAQGVDPARLDAAMTYLAGRWGRQGTSQAVVIKNGYMIWKGKDIDNKHKDYGFNWWTNGGKKREWPDAPPKTYAARGHKNNQCFIIPEWNMVIVRLGTDGGSGPNSTFFRKMSEAVTVEIRTPAEDGADAAAGR